MKLIIFDLDGTLLNTIEDLGNACNHALEHCGFPKHGIEKYNGFVGRGICNLFRAALPEGMRSEENIARMKEAFLEYYEKHKCDCTKPYPGITGLLDKLEAANIKIAVASNKYQDGTEKLVRNFFGKYRFSCILGQRDGKPIKPDPEIIYEIMEVSGIADRNDVIYAGDSDVDMQTGLNAGVRTIGVTWGFRTEEELSSYSPWKIAHVPEDIMKAINI